jgi:hypothetical protein
VVQPIAYICPFLVASNTSAFSGGSRWSRTLAPIEIPLRDCGQNSDALICALNN